MSTCPSDTCSAGDQRLRDKSLGGVYRFEFPITKDGADEEWVGINSVSLLFKRPDGTEVGPFAAVLETPDAGVWYYETTVDDLDTVGYWTLSVTVTDGSIVVEWPYEISFRVRDQ